MKKYVIYCYVQPNLKVYLMEEQKTKLYFDFASKLFLPCRNIMFDEDIKNAIKFDNRDFALKVIESLLMFIKEDFKLEVF